MKTRRPDSVEVVIPVTVIASAVTALAPRDALASASILGLAGLRRLQPGRLDLIDRVPVAVLVAGHAVVVGIGAGWVASS